MSGTMQDDLSAPPRPQRRCLCPKRRPDPIQHGSGRQELFENIVNELI